MKIALSAESTIDLPVELLQKYNIHTTPFTILLGDEAKLDGEVPVPEIIDFVNKTGTLPKTSAVNQYQYKEHWDKLLEEYDAVIHFSLSSEISVACHNAKTCAQDYDNVFVIGGAMFYRTMLPYCEEIFVTKVDADGEATVFYPNLDELEGFEMIYESESVESNGLNIKFTTYKNNLVKEF